MRLLLLLTVILSCHLTSLAQTSKQDSIKASELKEWIRTEDKDRNYIRSTLEEITALNTYFSSSQDSISYLRTLLEIGLYHKRTNNPLKSIPYFEKTDSLIKKMEITNNYLVRQTKTSYADVLTQMGRISEAVDIMTSLVSYLKVHFPEDLDRSYFNISATYRRAKQREMSSIYSDSALAELRRAGLENNSQLAAYIYQGNSLNLSASGYYNEALESLRKSKQILINNNSYNRPYYRAGQYLHMAYVNNYTKNTARIDSSITYAKKGLAEFKTIDSLDFYNYYFHSLLANDFLTQNRLTQALKAERNAIKLLKHNYEEENEDIVFEYSRMAKIFSELRQKDSANFYFKKAVAFYDKKAATDLNDQKIDVLLQYAIANVHILPEDVIIKSIEQSKESINKLTENNLKAEAFYTLGKTYHELYKKYPKKKYLIKAKDAVLKSINSVMASKEAIFNLQSKSLYFERQSNFFDYAMELCYLLYELEPSKEILQDAILIAELYRSSQLREKINDSKIPSKNYIPKELYIKEQKLLSSINLLEKEFFFLSAKDTTLSHIEVKEKELEDKRSEMFEVLSDIKRKYPQYYKLNYEDISNVELLSQNIESFLHTNNSSNLQLITYQGSQFYYFIEVASKRYKIRRLQRNERSEKLISSFVQSLQKRQSDDYKKLGVKAYEFIFQGSILNKKSTKKINISPDGIFNMLPFEALITEYNQPELRNKKEFHYLIEDYIVTYSNSILDKKVDNKTPLFKNVLALAPFAPSDAPNKTENSLRTALGSLPHSKKEILNFKDFTGAQTLLANQASETSFWKKAPTSSLIHLATHGVYDDEGAVNSFLLMSQDSLNDGRLYSYELFNKSFSADFIALSACESGLGFYKKGEGVINFARGFQYANIPNVLMSLWKVSDQATAELMKVFYDNLEQGASYTQGLREAKLNLIQSDDETSHPYYWAAFVLNGPGSQGTSWFQRNWIVLTILIVFLGTTSLFFIKK